MFAKKFIVGMVSLVILIASAVQVSAGDNLPIFTYKGIVKRYDDDLKKVVSYTYNAYMVIGDSATGTTAVWFGVTGKEKWFWVDDGVPVTLDLLDDKGTAFFAYSDTDIGFGKVTLKNGAISAVSVTGSIADTVYGETGTFALKYNSSLSANAVKSGTDAVDAVVAYLIAQKYVEDL